MSTTTTQKKLPKNKGTSPPGAVVKEQVKTKPIFFA
jgi:hypothetical protein